MISVIGNLGEITKVDIKIGTVPVSSCSFTFQLGQIPTGYVSFPPELMTSTLFDSEALRTITVNGHPIFTGYYSGMSGSRTWGAISDGVTFIHKARDLDQGSVLSPGIHMMSTEDYTYPVISDDDTTKPYLSSFDIGGDIPKEVIKYITQALTQTLIVTNKEFQDLPDQSGKNSEAVAAMNAIVPMSGCTMSVAKGSTFLVEAGEFFMKSMVKNSLMGKSSAWDMLASIFTSFGLNLICFPDGQVGVCPDFSGCKPPGANFIPSQYVIGYNAGSSVQRNPSSVVVVGYGLDAGEGGAFNPTQQNQNPPMRKLVVWSPKKTKNKGGAFVTGLPGWMSPVSYKLEIPKILPRILTEYAKYLFYAVSNAGRTYSITTPLCPSARVGTTYWFNPTSAVQTLSGDKIGNGAKYAGLCHKVTHTADSEGKLHTNFQFKNVYVEREFGDMLSGAPFYGGVAPFSI